MASINEFLTIDVTKGVARPDCIFKGKTYRITILSDVLVRLEYNEMVYLMTIQLYLQ